jgi:HAE1 family hydrophobic/amphiphilic exporter-1
VITLYITPVIYLFLDRYSGTGPMTDKQLESDAAAPHEALHEVAAVERKQRMN